MNKFVPLSFCVLMAAPAALGSTVLYTNFGSSGSPYQGGGWVVKSTQQVSFGFSVNAALPLLEIAVPVFWNVPVPGLTPDQPLTIDLLGPFAAGQQTPGGAPPVLESWVVAPTGASVTSTVHHLASSLQPVLDPQQRYFIRMSSPGLSEPFQWAWNLNNQGATGVVFGNVFSNQVSPTLQVLGADGSAVPEPSSAALIATALGAVARMRRRHARG